MSNIFLISDTHFFDHEMLMYYTPNGNKVRDFASVEEMNEHMVDRWNSVVGVSDTVYHLGDVFYDRTPELRLKFEELWFRLNGKKKLTVGNHDDLRYLSGKAITKDRWLFKDVHFWKKLPEFGVFLSHDPKHTQTLYSSTDLSKQLHNIHGHTHTNGSPEGPYTSVCVELVDYTPKSLEEIASEIHRSQ